MAGFFLNQKHCFTETQELMGKMKTSVKPLRRIGCIIMPLFIIGILAAVIGKIWYEGTPSYVFNHATIPFEEYSLVFFQENKDDLFRLADINEQFDEGMSYSTGINYDEEIPALPEALFEEAQDISARLKASGERLPREISVLMYDKSTKVYTGSGRCFVVYLYYGDTDRIPAVENGLRITPLERGWSLISEYRLEV